MGKKMLYFIAILMTIITVVVFAVFAEDPGERAAKNFLESYGWEVDEAIESSEIIIPKPFDMVYENYNKLQLKAGLNLKPYEGAKGIRYTYKIENFPIYMESEVMGNVICIYGRPVGGDIMTVSADGFMESLNFLAENR